MTDATPSPSPNLIAAGLSRSEAKGQPHVPRSELRISLDGIDGDRHAGPGLRQISLIHRDVVQDRFPNLKESDLVGRGLENILVSGVGLADFRILDTLELGEALVEITQIGKRVNQSGRSLCSADSKCLLSDFGIFARTLHGGTMEVGSPIRHQPRLLRAHIVTVSDRASRGIYEDKSGPATAALLNEWCLANHWDLWFESQIVPDDVAALDSVLENARQSGVDLVITTGGTGVGPRDITPDVVTRHADKLIPGIMDFIRLKHGERFPMALTSRSVAAVMGSALVYTLPGSDRAIPEYLEEIFKTMEHMLLLLKGLDLH